MKQHIITVDADEIIGIAPSPDTSGVEARLNALERQFREVAQVAADAKVLAGVANIQAGELTARVAALEDGQPQTPPDEGPPTTAKGDIGVNPWVHGDWTQDDPVDNQLLHARDPAVFVGGMERKDLSLQLDPLGQIVTIPEGQTARVYVLPGPARTRPGTFELEIDDWSKAKRITLNDARPTYDDNLQRIIFQEDAYASIEISGGSAPPPKLVALSRREQRAKATSIFADHYIETVSRFACFRPMDWQQTNGPDMGPGVPRRLRTRVEIEGDFAAARPLSYAHRGRSFLVADLIDLANRASVDLWLCVPTCPPTPDGDQLFEWWCRSAAELVHDRLRTGLRLHVEHSNEVWNDIFPQARLHGTDWNGRWLWHALRSSRMHEIFKAVLAERVSTKLGTKHYDESSSRNGLQYLRDRNRPLPDAIAIGVYCYGDTVAKLRADIGNCMARVQQHMAFGLPVDGYEGGEHSNNVQLASSPEMEGFYDEYVPAWRRVNPGRILNLYALIGGAWGMRQTFWGPDTGKARGYAHATAKAPA